MQSSRSPLNLLKQDLSRQFSGVEFENEIKNLGNVFEKCNKSELIEKYVESKNISKDKNHLNKNSISTNGTDSSIISGSYDEKISKLETIIEHKEEKDKNNNFEKNFNANDYIIKSQIGEGSFGKIFLVESKLNHKIYALKKIVAATKKDIQSLQHEYKLIFKNKYFSFFLI
jgi:hypothetical protein